MKKEELFKAETFDYICKIIKEKLAKTIKGNKRVWITEVKAENFDETSASNFEKELHIKFSIDLDIKDFCPMMYVDAIWYYNTFDAKDFAAIVVEDINKAFNGKRSVKKIDMMVQDKDSEIFSVYRKTIMDK